MPLYPAQVNQLQVAGGSIQDYFYDSKHDMYDVSSLLIPTSLLNQNVAGDIVNWQFLIDDAIFGFGGTQTNIPGAAGGIHNGALDPGQVQYTTGYNDQYSGVSGQQTFAKSMAISTANKIADQSNVKANTNIQFIAIDTGRATRTEDLLLDGAGNSTSTANSILCPFAQSCQR